MNRRSVLAIMGAGAGSLSGCQVLGSSNQPSTRTPPACNSSVPRNVELDGTEKLPSDAALSITATMERERVTGDEPARVQITVTNEGATREIGVTDDSRCHIFNRDSGRSHPEGLWLYRNHNAPSDRAGDCWTRNESPPEEPGFDGYGCERSSLESGESITTTYEVWDDYTVEGYMPPGRYRFEVSIPLWESQEDDDPDVFDWWLDLEVTSPES